MNNTLARLRIGNFLILFASLLWGLAYFFRKLILNDIHPLLLTFFVSVIATVTLFVVGRARFRSLLALFWRKPWQCIGLSFFGNVLGTTLMFLGLHSLDLSTATLLEKVQPLFVLFLAAAVLKEKIDKQLIPFIVLALVSSFFISTKTPFDLHISRSELLGVVYVVLAAFSWAVSSILGKHLLFDGHEPLELGIMRFGIGGVFLIPFFVFAEQLSLFVTYSLFLIMVVVFTSIVCSGLGIALYYHGLKNTTVSIAAFLELMTPLSSILLGTLFLSEALAVTQIVATPFFLYSIYRISSGQ